MTDRCQTCGISLAADPEGEHSAGHTLCWTHWRARNADAAPATGLQRQLAELRERLEELQEQVDTVESDVSALEYGGWR
jgi:TolA-binding protein